MGIGIKKTSDGAALMRACEQFEPRPLFEDPLTLGLLSGLPAVLARYGPVRRSFLRLMERAGPGFYGAVVCRTWTIDDECRSALAAGVTRVVILGAGLDTRAHRMPEMAAARVWEFDLPHVQAAKRAALRLPADPVTYRPIDLLSPAAVDDLAEAIDDDAPTLLLCEGVTMYLPDEAVERVVGSAASLPAGSRAVITYMTRDAADAAAATTRWWSRNLRWRSAYHPADIAAKLTAHGLTPLRDLGAEEHRERVLRPAGRDLAVYSGERISVSAKDA